MSRPVALLAVLGAVVAAGALLLLGGGRPGDDGRRIDVVFDSARGVQPGSTVKVAGARVGEVAAVRLTPERRALVSLRLDRDAAVPAFRADARCAIRPEGLIAESFVSCEPGSRTAPTLRGRDGRPPRIPVSRTSRPVSLADLLNLWSLPTGERARVLIAQLGLGLAGRGDDLGAIVERAVPSLAAARRLLTALDRQRGRLRSTVERTHRATALLAARRTSIRRATRASSALAARVARRRGDLAATIRRTPALLARARPALADLDRLTAAAEPLLDAAERSAPGLVRLSAAAGPVARRGTRTIRALRDPLRRTSSATRRLAPLLPVVDRDLAAATPTLADSDRALAALRDGGFFEGLWSFFYRGASALSRYDASGHLLGGNIILSRCSPSTGIAVEGCSAWLRDDPGARLAPAHGSGR